MESVCSIPRDVAVKRLQTAVRISQGAKRASYAAPMRPAWWIEDKNVNLPNCTVAVVPLFASHSRHPWSLPQACAALVLYYQHQSEHAVQPAPPPPQALHTRPRRPRHAPDPVHASRRPRRTARARNAPRSPTPTATPPAAIATPPKATKDPISPGSAVGENASKGPNRRDVRAALRRHRVRRVHSSSASETPVEHKIVELESDHDWPYRAAGGDSSAKQADSSTEGPTAVVAEKISSPRSKRSGRKMATELKVGRDRVSKKKGLRNGRKLKAAEEEKEEEGSSAVEVEAAISTPMTSRVGIAPTSTNAANTTDSPSTSAMRRGSGVEARRTSPRKQKRKALAPLENKNNDNRRQGSKKQKRADEAQARGKENMGKKTFESMSDGGKKKATGVSCGKVRLRRSSAARSGRGGEEGDVEDVGTQNDEKTEEEATDNKQQRVVRVIAQLERERARVVGEVEEQRSTAEREMGRKVWEKVKLLQQGYEKGKAEVGGADLERSIGEVLFGLATDATTNIGEMALDAVRREVRRLSSEGSASVAAFRRKVNEVFEVYEDGEAV